MNQSFLGSPKSLKAAVLAAVLALGWAFSNALMQAAVNDGYSRAFGPSASPTGAGARSDHTNFLNGISGGGWACVGNNQRRHEDQRVSNCENGARISNK